jgi:hypothetical protein
MVFCNHFFSAFLLFWTQLILGKFIPPWFGGAPAVWTTCILFFQVVLLAGCANAHILTRQLSGWAQAFTHCVVLLSSVGLLAGLRCTCSRCVRRRLGSRSPANAQSSCRVYLRHVHKPAGILAINTAGVIACRNTTLCIWPGFAHPATAAFRAIPIGCCFPTARSRNRLTTFPRFVRFAYGPTTTATCSNSLENRAQGLRASASAYNHRSFET